MAELIDQRREKINYLADAYEWLKADPTHYETADTGRAHVVRIIAAAGVDEVRPVPTGVCFIEDQSFTHDGQLLSRSSVKLVNHADTSSFQDYLPVKNFGDDMGRIDVGEMSRDTRTFTDERIARMALNAETVMGVTHPR